MVATEPQQSVVQREGKQARDLTYRLGKSVELQCPLKGGVIKNLPVVGEESRPHLLSLENKIGVTYKLSPGL